MGSLSVSMDELIRAAMGLASLGALGIAGFASKASARPFLGSLLLSALLTFLLAGMWALSPLWLGSGR